MVGGGLQTFHPGCIEVLERRFFYAPDTARQRAQVFFVVNSEQVHPPRECCVHPGHEQIFPYEYGVEFSEP